MTTNSSQPRTNTLSIIAFILALLEIPSFYLIFRFAFSNEVEIGDVYLFLPFIAIAVMIVSSIARKQTIKRDEKGKGFARAALIIAIIVTVFTILPILILILYAFTR